MNALPELSALDRVRLAASALLAQNGGVTTREIADYLDCPEPYVISAFIYLSSGFDGTEEDAA